MGRSRGIPVLAAALIGGAAIAAGALGATGALTPRGCIEDTGQDECSREAPGLDGAISVAIRGGSVYTVSSNDDAVVRFKRAR
jgi:hypothetical protein